MKTLQTPNVVSEGNTHLHVPQWLPIQHSTASVFFEPSRNVFPLQGNASINRPANRKKRRSEPPLSKEVNPKAKKSRLTSIPNYQTTSSFFFPFYFPSFLFFLPTTNDISSF